MGRTTLLAEYAYVLKPGGICYTVTDVKGSLSFRMYLCDSALI
jgi:tRNA G46 methylase TrmB